MTTLLAKTMSVLFKEHVIGDKWKYVKETSRVYTRERVTRICLKLDLFFNDPVAVEMISDVIIRRDDAYLKPLADYYMEHDNPGLYALAEMISFIRILRGIQDYAANRMKEKPDHGIFFAGQRLEYFDGLLEVFREQQIASDRRVAGIDVDARMTDEIFGYVDPLHRTPLGDKAGHKKRKVLVD